MIQARRLGRCAGRKGRVAAVAVVKTPIDLEVRFKNYRPAELLAYLPNVTSLDAHATRLRAKDISEDTRFLDFALNHEPGLAP